MASKRLKAAQSENDDELKVDMSPMIDMVFLLLIFFIVASTVVIVKQDPNVEPPVANKSKLAQDGAGRIVLNVRIQGEFYDELGKTKFDDDEAIYSYVKEMKAAEERKGIQKPMLHLRADKGVSFQYVRRAIRAAARAGVENVNFSVYSFEKN